MFNSMNESSRVTDVDNKSDNSDGKTIDGDDQSEEEIDEEEEM